MAQCKMKWMAAGDASWWYCVLDEGHVGKHRDDQGRGFFKPPYPFCSMPQKCVNGRCEREHCCAD